MKTIILLLVTIFVTITHMSVQAMMSQNNAIGEQDSVITPNKEDIFIK